MDTVGDRMKQWRRRRGGMSQRTLADLAGLSQGYVSQIESGQKPLDRKSTQVAIAQALNITVPQLLGQPATDADPVRDRAVAYVPAIRDTLIELAYGERRPPRRDATAVRAAVSHATDLRNAADYGAIAPLLPDLLMDLAGHGMDLGGEMVETLFTTRFTLRTMGHMDLSREAAEVAVTVARDYGDPAWIGQAAYNLVQAFPQESAVVGHRMAVRAADELDTAKGRGAREVYGCLHLLAALESAVANQAGQAYAHLDEAEQVARSVGEPQRRTDLTAGWNGNWFGPTQVAIWRITINAELGEAGAALESAARVDMSKMPVPNRHVYFWTDQARALAALGKDREAMGALAKAERSAPQHFRFSPATRDLTASLIARAKRRAVAGELSDMARKLGLHPL
ncbi:helix-turn-helix domain-containing protein [Micromonospora sp. WMMC273]|uniref:helix-turn-helix domain-containing protein n=1 Tax=Micromonospora sp. WMMC273 TaxID=3015157 RepID=UPI0022B71408|nr:helix-turn-helix transcriptional regulator [Micromonospora sp. WMMC273]MCZ7478862.1 helix-turn-helix transcriptional regulator [Micromonospora sp. WMMC273]MCZ7478971.1 helix-turn-helix transcriptional regulator [Micromonospora sp. WMMC273]